MTTKCTRCRWYKNGKGINCVSYFGNPLSKIVFCGEAFGASEAEIGEPFVGDAGQKFNKLLAFAQLQRKDVIVMNAIRCYLEGNPTPTKRELDSCFIHIVNDLATIKPNLIVAMGGSAFYSLTGKTGITEYRGNILYSDKVKCNVFPTFHPASCLYDQGKWEILKKDFALIPSLIGKKIDIVHYYFFKVEEESQVQESINTLSKSDCLYIDTEATGLDPYIEELTRVQVGSENDRYLIGLDLVPKYKELLETKPIVGQGWEFDAKYLKLKYNIFPTNWYFDTCIAEYFVSGLKNNDLDALTLKYVPESAGYSDEVNAVGGAHRMKDPVKKDQYAIDDIGVLPKIKKKQDKQLKDMGMDWLFYNIAMPCNRILTEMTLRGVKYDVDTLKETDVTYAKRANRLLVKVENLTSVKECERFFNRKFNPRSSQMISWLISEYYKLPTIKKTKKDNIKVGKTEMERYAKHPFNNEYCKIMQEYRSIETLRSGFLSGVIPKLKDGIAHTKYSLHATTSGRPNSTKINLLNIPRNKDIKRCIVARDGHTFVSADQSQLEVRVAAVVYNEPRLIDICNDFSKDIHSAITAKAFNKTYDEVYNGYKNKNTFYVELRVKGKGIQFGVIYGETEYGLSYNLNITEEEAKKFISDYYNNFPDLSSNIELAKKKIIQDGYLSNFFGFRRSWEHHKEDDSGTLREGVNFLVQSLAWNLLEISLIKVDKIFKKEGFKARPILQVYDNIVIEAPDEEVKDVSAILKECMETANIEFEGEYFNNINRVKLKTDVEIGKSLADLSEFGVDELVLES
ncbi:hypothetical protein AUJ83_03405 [Candidatus Woesearchaeota archaeon CG1_02_33_12]|nr:MAG: hypothetical protein AUJ83_03405 [Candidatus Woesearchaeota archaeon CG1_02_33_12]